MLLASTAVVTPTLGRKVKARWVYLHETVKTTSDPENTNGILFRCSCTFLTSQHLCPHARLNPSTVVISASVPSAAKSTTTCTDGHRSLYATRAPLALSSHSTLSSNTSHDSILAGIGLEGAKVLAASGDWHVIMAVRSFAKAEAGAKDLGMDPSTYTVMNLDLASLNSVRNFVAEIKAAKIKPDALVCNAAVWHPKVRGSLGVCR